MIGGSELTSPLRQPVKYMPEFSDKQIVTSWHTNARPWTKAVRNQEIESRTLVTDQAIVQAVTSLTPRRVLDVGCGEGWLARALVDRGIEVVGIDVVPELIAEAQRLGRGRFQLCSYEDIAAGRFSAGRFDTIICNFSLLGKDSVEHLLHTLPQYMQPQGQVVIQTLHPVLACGDWPYCDGWRPGSWEGFGPEFTDPAPWYFRTVESWIRLLRDSGFDILECREPIHPRTGKPASIIFVSQAAERSVSRQDATGRARSAAPLPQSVASPPSHDRGEQSRRD